VATDLEKIELLTLLNQRRVEHLCLEAPELLEVGGELAEAGLIRCGGGRPIYNQNGKLTDIMNAEITASGRAFLEEKLGGNALVRWLVRNRNLLILATGAGILLFVFLKTLWENHIAKTEVPQQVENAAE
jgi:hypothetical protein